ncbi:MAG: retroviral-like aspartic protease [Cytophagales bacterium]|nr:retroviral-like aspartic protease [Cytophagales bacterium]
MDACLPKQIQEKLTLNIPAFVRARFKKPQAIQVEMDHPKPPLKRQSGIPSKKSVRFSDIVEEHILEEARERSNASDKNEAQPQPSSSQQATSEQVQPYFYKITSPDHTDACILNKCEGRILMMKTCSAQNVTCSQPSKPYIRLGPSEFPITIQGVEIIALLDTGSTLTVLPARTVKRLNLTELAPPKLTTATSMTGHTLSFLGTKIVNMKIGNESFSHEVHIAPDTSVKYECIIGTDLLSHIPKFTIDYKNGMAQFNQSTLPIGAPKAARKVCLEQGIEIPPRTQATLVAKLQGFQNEEEGKPFMLDPVDSFLQTTGLALGQILAAPNNVGSVPVMIINPGFAPAYIYPRSTVAAACEVSGYYIPTGKSVCPDGQTQEAMDEPERINLLTSLDMVEINDQRQPAEFFSPLDRKSGLMTITEITRRKSNDKLFMLEVNVDYEDIKEIKISNDLSENQKKQLKDLLHKYADRFSKQRFDLGKAKDCEHSIDTGDAPPFKSRPYRTPIAQ